MIAMPHVTVEHRGLRWFNDALTQWLAVSPASHAAGLRRAAGLLTGRLIQFTPPLAKAGTSGGRQGTNARRQGEKAVKRDILRAITPLDPDDWKSPVMKRLIKAGIPQNISRFFRSQPSTSKLHDAKVVLFSPRWHRQARMSKGRVHRAQGVFTLDKRAVKNYIRKVQKNVGIARGGWASAAENLGLQPPEWIRRHKGQGYFRDSTASGGGILIANHSPWADYDAQRICNNALESVSRQMFRAVAIENRRAHLLQ